MKKILIVSPCGKRRNTTGIIGKFLSSFEGIDKTKYYISLFDTNFYERNHNPEDYQVDNYFKLDDHWYDTIIRKLPGFRVKYANQLVLRKYLDILRKEHYDLVLVVQVPEYSDELVRIAHDNGVKIVFLPFGSDILRVSDEVRNKLKKAFAEVDGVCGYENSGTINAARDVYNVPQEKLLIQQLYLESVNRLNNLQGRYTRKEMMDVMGIPFSEYNIVCGYSGRETHRHKFIIESLIKIKDVLPDGYQIIFPMTYGAGAHHEIIIRYAAQLKELCDSEGLNAVFLTDFMSDEQMAYLHLITDLFIEIQPTDNGNAFMIEAICAENQIVTGRWLKYANFEQFGEPYYLIETPDELPEMLRKIFTHQVDKAVVPQKLLDLYLPTEDKKPCAFWSNLFDTL